MAAIHLLRTATRRATQWHVYSQDVARHNARVASTALTQSRMERLEVEEFLAVHQRQYAARQRISLQHRSA